MNRSSGLLLELTRQQVPFMIVGLGAAVIQGADKVLPIERVLVSKRAANRLKDLAVIPALEAAIEAIASIKRLR